MWLTTHLRYAGVWVCEAPVTEWLLACARGLHQCLSTTRDTWNVPRTGANIAVQYVKMSHLGPKKPDVPKRGLWDNFSRVQDVAIPKRMEMHHEHDSPNLP